MARRSGTEWFIGAITNYDPRTLELETNFLKSGKYKLEAILDGINANTRAEDYKKVVTEFIAGEKLKLNLASGGGWVARIVPID
jgi:alpha-glucosidase